MNLRQRCDNRDLELISCRHEPTDQEFASNITLDERGTVKNIQERVTTIMSIISIWSEVNDWRYGYSYPVNGLRVRAIINHGNGSAREELQGRLPSDITPNGKRS
ncbi:hypothetical protein PIB30_061099 [Stylosanthes scabra]|uniref:Uncharacterized protein n=1 Tax=Stylosanthes scabra TaxID=79078 RepID=A0ABU6VJP1_9FABA|nr:hypothetical protein [Stylosanthes scabra]